MPDETGRSATGAPSGPAGAPTRLYGFFRSSAAWRCRIALNLKGLPYDTVPVNFRTDDQRSDRFRTINPQGLVPALVTGGRILTQSLAIVEWLEETRPEPALLPADAFERAEVRAFGLAIAADIHPVNNLRVLNYLKGPLGRDQSEVDAWYRHWVEDGLAACEELVRRADRSGPYCFGGTPGLADICLVPQLYNARRFGCDLGAAPRLVEIGEACAALPAFAAAHPDNQPDTVG